MGKTTPPDDQHEDHLHGTTYKAIAANKWLLIWAGTTSSATLILQIWQITKG